jgi:membrane-associated protease RseP (regulator of RpoE activity)
MYPSSNDVSFRLFGFLTIIQPFFWVIAILITAVHLGDINNNMPFWLAQVIVGAAGVLFSILVHELGHALTFRHLFHTPCTIVLHGFGGMAIPQHHRRKYGFLGTVAECFLAFSGPLAGFVLAFFAIILLRFFPPAGNGGTAVALFHFFLVWMAMISIFWGFFNLLPIYPLDGGHIARAVFVFFFPHRGIEFSLILSMVLAVMLVAAALQYGEIFIALIFAYFAYQNYQEFSIRSFRR